jgi:NADP-dependent 3-hydroxy acid dehydrogenase YdfG
MAIDLSGRIVAVTGASSGIGESRHIVNVSSVAGRIARSGSGVYNLTKFGVGAFSESLRQEAVPLGVRVTLVEPGAVAPPSCRATTARRYSSRWQNASRV